jgi:hypothetical protein
MSENFSYQNRFRFVLEDNTYKSSAIEMVLTGITIPGVSLGIIEKHNYIKPVYIPGNEMIMDELIINFNIDENWASWIEIFNWFKSIKSTTELSETIGYKDASLIILNSKYNPQFSIKFTDIFPVNLAPVDMLPSIETLDTALTSITFKINDMKIETTL